MHSGKDKLLLNSFGFKIETAHQDDIILEKGDDAKHLYVILEGSVMLSYSINALDHLEIREEPINSENDAFSESNQDFTKKPLTELDPELSQCLEFDG